MFEINQNVVFVQGFIHGAIYDFNTGKVYWVNDEACEVISKYINGVQCFVEEDSSYISQLMEENLCSMNFKPCKYLPENDESISLQLVWLEITQACNAKCIHCYQGDNHNASRTILTTNKWKQIITELSKESVNRIVVIGGEPCCHADLKDILLHICSHKIPTTLFSNGTLFTDDLINAIINNRDYIRVKTSMYGHNSLIHDKITTIDGSFNKLVNTIKLLQSKNVAVDIAVIAMKENQDFMDNIRNFIIQMGLEYSGYDVIRNVFGGKQDQHTPDSPIVLERSRYSKPVFYTSKEQFAHSYSRNTCWYGKLAITETGDVLPCVFERTTTYGNVVNDSIQDILSSLLLKDNWFKSFRYIDECKCCEFRYACKDCRPLGKSVGGDMNGKNPRCLYNPHTGVWA